MEARKRWNRIQVCSLEELQALSPDEEASITQLELNFDVSRSDVRDNNLDEVLKWLENANLYEKVCLVIDTGRVIQTESFEKLAAFLTSDFCPSNLTLMCQGGYSKKPMGDQEAIFFADALRNLSSNIKCLDLYFNYNNIGDKGAIELASALKNCSCEVMINLTNNQIKEEGGTAFLSLLNEHAYPPYMYVHIEEGNSISAISTLCELAARRKEQREHRFPVPPKEETTLTKVGRWCKFVFNSIAPTESTVADEKPNSSLKPGECRAM